jgi:hypothetical protein
LDNVPMPAGAAVAAGAIGLAAAGAPSGVLVAWAMTTGATPLAAGPSVETVDAWGAFMVGLCDKRCMYRGNWRAKSLTDVRRDITNDASL